MWPVIDFVLLTDNAARGDNLGLESELGWAVREELRRRGQPVETLWLGSETGLEREAAAREGIPFRVIPTGKLRRYLSMRTLTDAVRVPFGVLQARRHLRAAFRG